jgi:hypothetical protein
MSTCNLTPSCRRSEDARRRSTAGLPVRAAPVTASFKAPSTGATYIVNTKPATYEAAEAFCKRNGGHLASYKSLEEQNETESFFLASGAQQGSLQGGPQKPTAH